MILLTVNVATLKTRCQKRVEHLKYITPKWVELNIDFGVDCLGLKRQRMLENSKGEYSIVIDDDDEITENYFSELLIGIKKGVDVITVPVERYYNNKLDTINYNGVTNPNKTCDYVSHFCAIKTNLALKSGYRAIGFGEDLDFCLGLKDILKTAYHIKKPIYKQYYVDRQKEYNKFKSYFDFEPRILTGSKPFV